jgi:hypothetical protein
MVEVNCGFFLFVACHLFGKHAVCFPAVHGGAMHNDWLIIGSLLRHFPSQPHRVTAAASTGRVAELLANNLQFSGGDPLITASFGRFIFWITIHDDRNDDGWVLMMMATGLVVVVVALCWLSDGIGLLLLKLCCALRQKTFSVGKARGNVGELCQQRFSNCCAIRSSWRLPAVLLLLCVVGCCVVLAIGRSLIKISFGIWKKRFNKQ